MRAEPGTPEREIERAGLYAKRDELIQQQEAISSRYADAVCDALLATTEQELPETIEAIRKVLRDFVPIAGDLFRYARKDEIEAGFRMQADIDEVFTNFYSNVVASAIRRLPKQEAEVPHSLYIALDEKAYAIPVEVFNARLGTFKLEKRDAAKPYYEWIREYVDMLVALGGRNPARSASMPRLITTLGTRLDDHDRRATLVSDAYQDVALELARFLREKNASDRTAENFSTDQRDKFMATLREALSEEWEVKKEIWDISSQL